MVIFGGARRLDDQGADLDEIVGQNVMPRQIRTRGPTRRGHPRRSRHTPNNEDQLRRHCGVPGCVDTTRRGVVRVRRTTPADGMGHQDSARRTTAHRPTSRSKARNDSASRQPNGLRIRCSSRAPAPSEGRYGPVHSSATNSQCPRVLAEVHKHRHRDYQCDA
jgi:hypothetical protein